jgi:uncharacterized protein (AIM24 family)
LCVLRAGSHRDHVEEHAGGAQRRPATYADPQAAIAWSASLQTGFHRADQLGLGTLLGRSTGEAFTMSFAGQGFVIVQPSEELPENTASGSDESGGGGLTGR